MFFVSSQMCWDGTNLLSKRERNVTFQEGRREEAFIKLLYRASSLQAPFHPMAFCEAPEHGTRSRCSLARAAC